jgi:glycosyltransferase involved in cell wall biosynthesis
MADGFLLTLEGNSPVSLTIPAKLQGYMGAGKPVLAAINGGANDVITAAECGKCVPAGDADGLRQIIEAFVAEPEAFRALGANGKQYFLENFTLTKYISTLEKIMGEMK